MASVVAVPSICEITNYSLRNAPPNEIITKEKRHLLEQVDKTAVP